MVDIDNLSAFDFNRLIAERVGWTELEVRQCYEENCQSDHYGDHLHGVNPDYEKYGDTPVPLYSQNTDDALTLVTGNLRISIHNEDHPNWIAQIWDDIQPVQFDKMRYYLGSDISLARAICRAWLEWKDRKES